MGKSHSKEGEFEGLCEDEELQAAKKLVEEKGVAGAQAVMKEQLENWRDVEIKIGITGDSGVGKSSFVNSFRGLDDEEEGAAATGYVETTWEPACYTYPDNPGIILMDLPGIGTPTFPNLETYCKRVNLETYDTFLILTASRFTNNDLLLAQKIKSMEKSFFFIRTKIDVDETNEKRKKRPDVEAMSKRIRANCLENVKDLGISEDKIFLICNHEPDTWDFQRLVQEILDALPTQKQEALTLSLKIFSKDIVRKRVQIFKDQLWRISVLFFAAVPLDLAVLPLTITISMFVGVVRHLFQPAFGKFQDDSLQNVCDESSAVEDLEKEFAVAEPVGLLSITFALALLGRKSEYYRSQLGIPEEDSDEFKYMKPDLQERTRKFYPRKGKSFLKRCFAIFKMRPGSTQADTEPHDFLVKSLKHLLDEMQQLSFDILDDAATVE